MDDQYELLITGLLEKQYGTADQFIPAELIAALRGHLLQNFEAGQMKPASIGQHFSLAQNLKIRGDLIFWLEKEHNAAEKEFLDLIENFIRYLNQTCYTGINACEFHYAVYEPGTFYKRHLDQFKLDQGRQFSMIVYLNEDWSLADEGQLILYTTAETVQTSPIAGRAMFFKADEVEHEVKASSRARMSIAGWLKRI